MPGPENAMSVIPTACAGAALASRPQSTRISAAKPPSPPETTWRVCVPGRLPAPGSRLPGSRLPAPGSRLPAPGSRLPAPG